MYVYGRKGWREREKEKSLRTRSAGRSIIVSRFEARCRVKGVTLNILAVCESVSGKFKGLVPFLVVVFVMKLRNLISAVDAAVHTNAE